jgi:hypothetical protein
VKLPAIVPSTSTAAGRVKDSAQKKRATQKSLFLHLQSAPG